MNPKKVEQVAYLKQLLQEYSAVIVINYSGLNVTQSQLLRNKLRENNTMMFVARNTLMAIAAEQSEHSAIKELLGGQLAFIFAQQSDIPAGTKALLAVIKEFKLDAEIVGGVIQNDLLKPNEVTQLAKLPAYEVLVAQLLGLLNSPVSNLAGVLNNTIASFAIVLNAISQQKEQN